MSVMDLNNLPTPERVDLGYSTITSYPHISVKEDSARIIHSFDPKRTGYVHIQSYANCPSREHSKEVFLTHMDFKNAVKAFETNTSFRNSVLDGVKRNAIDELIKSKSTGAGFSTVQMYGRDLGLDDETIEAVFGGEYV
ncbi:hypothetical protein HNP86_001582 [Methanococcus maripaludis]|uniref:Uncharacterized protein n=1 Tax=Methanococcus maripaludis TaxID=39152 RepID=A0A7J9NUS7_METMI|nr:hypothetical protein [Methanococcus maripaludis]MBA2846178.1 hypothetical protein [Methanococcus maripaludis]MBA2851429.1 hypothetical protein [Methanococcus maripaludis]